MRAGGPGSRGTPGTKRTAAPDRAAHVAGRDLQIAVALDAGADQLGKMRGFRREKPGQGRPAARGWRRAPLAAAFAPGVTDDAAQGVKRGFAESKGVWHFSPLGRVIGVVGPGRSGRAAGRGLLADQGGRHGGVKGCEAYLPLLRRRSFPALNSSAIAAA